MPVAHLTTQSAMNACVLYVDHANAAAPQSQIALQTNANPFAYGKSWFMASATLAAERGDKLIERMAFWSALPFVGDAIAGKLADKLERVTDEVESYVGLAA